MSRHGRNPFAAAVTWIVVPAALAVVSAAAAPDSPDPTFHVTFDGNVLPDAQTAAAEAGR